MNKITKKQREAAFKIWIKFNPARTHCYNKAMRGNNSDIVRYIRVTEEYSKRIAIIYAQNEE